MRFATALMLTAVLSAAVVLSGLFLVRPFTVLAGVQLTTLMAVAALCFGVAMFGLETAKQR